MKQKFFTRRSSFIGLIHVIQLDTEAPIRNRGFFHPVHEVSVDVAMMTPTQHQLASVTAVPSNQLVKLIKVVRREEKKA